MCCAYGGGLGIAGWLVEARRELPITSRLVYLDNAGAGPLPRRSVEAAERFLEKWMLDGEPWEEGLEAVVEAKRLFSALVGASPDEVAAVPGATYGFNAVLSSLRLRGGSVVVGSENFPTTYYSLHGLRRRGLVSEIRFVEHTCPSPEAFEKLVDDTTELVMVDYVSWISGCRYDLRALAEIAHEHGALLVTDAFHAVGVIPVDVKSLKVDVLVTGTYKWLLGPHGAGFVYVRRELLDSLEPSLSGWMGIEDSVVARMLSGREMFGEPFDIHVFKPAPSAAKLEWGTWPIVSFVAAAASLRFILDYEAPQRYETHTGRLVEALMEGLAERGYQLVTPPQRRAGIVVFQHRSPHSVARRLRREGIVVSARPGRIRVSPHFYNTMEEVELFIEKLVSADRHGP